MLYYPRYTYLFLRTTPVFKANNRFSPSESGSTPEPASLPFKPQNNLDVVAVVYLQAKQLEKHNQRYKVQLYKALQYLAPGAQLLSWGVALFLLVIGTRGLINITDAREFCEDRATLESCQDNPWVQRSAGENTRVILTRLLAIGLVSGGLYLVIRVSEYLQEVMIQNGRGRNFWQKELELYSSQRNIAILHGMREQLSQYPHQPDQSTENEYLRRTRDILSKLTLIPYDGAEHEARLQMQCQANIRTIDAIRNKNQSAAPLALEPQDTSGPAPTWFVEK